MHNICLLIVRASHGMPHLLQDGESVEQGLCLTPPQPSTAALVQLQYLSAAAIMIIKHPVLPGQCLQ